MNTPQVTYQLTPGTPLITRVIWRLMSTLFKYPNWIMRLVPRKCVVKPEKKQKVADFSVGVHEVLEKVPRIIKLPQ